MDFVNKENVARLQVHEEADDIPWAFEGGGGGDFATDVHFGRQDQRHGGFTEAGGAVQQDVIEGFVTGFGSTDRDFEDGFEVFLAGVIAEGLGAEGFVGLGGVTIDFGFVGVQQGGGGCGLRAWAIVTIVGVVGGF